MTLTPKEYLRQVHRLHVLIEQRTAEREALKAFDGIGGIDYAEDRVQATRKSDAVFVKTVERLIMLDRQIAELIGEYSEKKNRIIGEIHRMEDPTYISVLYKRYVEFKALEDIASEMGYSYEYMRHLHGYALKDFGERFLGSEKVDTQ